MQRFVALSLALAACGDGSNSGRLADAPPISDAAPGGAVQMVMVTVTNHGAPEAGVQVYFLGPDDAVIASVRTDAAGNATANMPSGGSVTAIDPFPAPLSVADNANELRTFLGVKPGDHLYLTGNPTTVDVTLNAPTVKDAAGYEVRTTCGSTSVAPGGGSGSGSGSGSQNLGGPLRLIGCTGATDVMVLAFLRGERTPVSALYHTNVSLTEGHTVDLTSDAYQPLVNVSFSYTGVPEGVSAVDVAYGLSTAHGVLDLGTRSSLTIDGGAATTTVPEPVLSGTRAVIVTGAFLQARHQIIDWGAPATHYALELGAALLPDITSAPPAFDPATQRLTWTEVSSTGPAPDLAAASLSVTRSNASTERSRTWHWEIAGPHAADGLKLPRLPTELLDWAPGARDSVVPETVVIAKLPGGYDLARPRIFDVRDGVSSAGAFSFAGAVAGESGRALTAEFQSPSQRAARRGR